MIKFFRKIRQKTLTENKLSKYLIYAVGEIILVVIGILIALQVNNWNENRKKINNELELLTSLEQEILENIEQLEELNTNNKPYKIVSNDALKKLDTESDSFTTKEISGIFNYNSSRIDSPVLDAIIESNSNLLIKRKRLISELRNLKITYQRIEKSEYFLDEFWNSKITDFFISCGLPFESYSSNDPLITIKDIELGGYSKKQFIGLINMKNDLQNYWELRQENAYLKSKEVLDKLQAE